MSFLYLLLLLVVWWIAAGLYGRRQSISRNLGDQPKLISAVLQGPFSVQKMLIWSTLSTATVEPQQSDQEERGRIEVPLSAPVLNPLSAAAQQMDPNAQAPQIISPVASPVINPASQGAPQAIRPAVSLVPEAALPAPPPVFSPEAAPLAASSEPEALQRPRRLPGPPLIGNIKCLCPACRKKTKFGKDALCLNCGQQSLWLAEKWGLADSAQTDPAAPLVAPEPIPPASSIPLVAPEPVASASSAPLVAPEPVSLAPSVPLVAPEPIAPSPPVPPMESNAPLSAPQPVASEASQPEPIPVIEVEEATELPPAGSEMPRKLPGKPLLGTVKCLCPWCARKTKFDKEAVCSECDRVSPWLTEKWGIEKPLPLVKPVVDGISIEALQLAHQQPNQPVEELVELDPDYEIEAFDQLPDRPRRGKVQTVCPHCHQRTKHDKEGLCQQCQQPNDWLRKRWGLVAMDAEVEVAAPVIIQQEKPVFDPNSCSGCGRQRATDLEGNCIFCGHTLETK